MKKSEIEIGKIYENKRGWQRQVVDISYTGKYKLYSAQEDNVTLRFKILSGRNVGREGNMTLATFAAWAKGTVTI